jgi:hypothetical protein
VTDDIVLISAAEWSRTIRGMACIAGDDGRVDLVAVTDLGEARVACEDGHEWVLAAPIAIADSNGRSGLLEEFGVYQALVETLRPDDPFVEYAVVEHRFADANPRLYADLVGRYGHTALGPRRFTVSSLLAGALSLLVRDGGVARDSGPATGRWSYNGQVSYWALPPASEAPSTSWVNYAMDRGIDAETWPPTDGLTGPRE